MQSFVQALCGRALLAGLLLAGCNPGAFDALATRARDAGAERDGSSNEGGATGDGGAETAGDGAAADGGESAGPGGRGGAGGAAGEGASVDTGGTGGTGAGGAAAGSGGAAAGSGGAAGTMAGAGGGAGSAGSTPPAPCSTASDPAKVKLSASDVGEIAMPNWVENRTVTANTVVRNRVLLVFSVPGAFGMAGWGSAQGLLSLPPRLEEQGPFVPLFESDAVATDRTITVGSAVADGSSALLYFAAINGFLVLEGAGVARLSLNGNRAEVLHAAGALFPPSGSGMDPWRPAFIHGAFVQTEDDVDYVYVYGCQSNPNNPDEAPGAAHDSPCRLARVPRTEASTGASYRYWSGTEWVDDVARAAVVIDHTSGGLSVSFNAFLGKYLAVHSGSNAVILRWADRPQGPWMPLGQFGTVTATGGFGSTFGAQEVPGLRDTCQRVTYVSYATTSQPEPTVPTRFSTHLVRVELQ